MTVELSTYTMSINHKGNPVVIIDLGDGFPEECTKSSLEGVIKHIEGGKGKFDNKRQFEAVLSLYQGALKFMNEHTQVMA